MSNKRKSEQEEIAAWYSSRRELQNDEELGQVPEGYVDYGDGVVRQVGMQESWRATVNPMKGLVEDDNDDDDFEPEPYIPPMDPTEERELRRILEQKMRHQGKRDPLVPFNDPPHIESEFKNPDGDDSFDMKKGDEEVVMPWIEGGNELTMEDEDFYEILRERAGFIRRVVIAAKTFDDAIIEIEVIFDPAQLRNLRLVEKANDIARAIATIVYRYIAYYYVKFAAYANRREFKVQVGFTAIFKKMKKELVNPMYKEANGNFDFLTFFKESMLTRDGVAIRFNSAAKSFKCTYNTTIDVINNCLDARNVPNMDSAWRYDSLKSATIKLYCYNISAIPGGYYCRIPPNIASKKACINPNTPSGCFWYSVKIALLLNQEVKIDYSKKEKEIQKEQHEVKKEHTKYQLPGNVLDKCAKMGIAHYWKQFPEEDKEEHLRFDLNPGVKEIIGIHQDDLPEDMPLDNKFFTKFCKLNPMIALSVFTENDDDYVGEKGIQIKLFFEGNTSLANTPVKLLFLGVKGEVGHYVCIKNFNRFLYNIDKCKRKKKVYCEQCRDYKLAGSAPCKHLKLKRKFEETDVFCCVKCMGTFESEEDLQKHDHMCLIVDKNYRVVELPDERKYLEFDERRTNNLTPIPTYMVADFESVLVPVGEDPENHTKSRITARHLPCAYGINVVSTYPELRVFTTYWGTSPEDTMRHFCQDIITISERVYQVYCRKTPIIMTENDIDDFNTRRCCYICCRQFFKESEKYRDHDHVTGKYLGAACNTCNLKRVQKNLDLPLIFHNAKGYDLHHIIKEITKKEYGCIFNGIAQNSEKIMSFTIMKKTPVINKSLTESIKKTMCDIKIIDSLLFLLKSLESLTGIMKKTHPTDLEKAFPILFRVMREKIGYTDEQIVASLNKNIYPYLWLDSFDKFNLPFSELEKLVKENKYEAFSDSVDETFKSSFEEKKRVFFDVNEKFKGQFNTVLDYADLYLMGDVLQLSDIIESARKTFFKTHYLDLIRYYGAPGYSWDAFLFHLKRKTSYRPELFISTEMNMVCFFMQCIRGGCSGIMKRFARANNHFIKENFEEDKPETFIVYLDANNLYGWAMSQNLPYKDFRWLSSSMINALNGGGEDYLKKLFADLRAKTEGCFFEVKLVYPKELHDKHNLYPLAPERRCIKESEVSYFTRHLHDKLHVKMNTKTPLLLQTLEDKDHYFIYWKNLELYLSLGMKLEHIYGGIRFKEAPIMKSYIELNTKLRNQRGASEFDKELYKLMNNSIYGKTLENPMKYSLLQFISTRKKFDKVVNKVGFDGTVFSQDEFCIAKVKYESIKYEKPLYIGATVTELAKYKMFDFYYNVMQKACERVDLLFTDTDSLMMEVYTHDLYQLVADINKDSRFGCPIDVSTFDKEIIEKYGIPTTNNKVIGAFKSETGSQQIAEFVGLRAKMYSYLVYQDNSSHLRAKGVAKSSLNMLSHQNYIDCLFNPDNPELARQSIEMKSIRSKKHDLSSIVSEKFGLSCNDTKRYIIPSGPGKIIETLAYGHFKIPEYEGTKEPDPEPEPTPEKPKEPKKIIRKQPSFFPPHPPPLKKNKGRPIKYNYFFFN